MTSMPDIRSLYCRYEKIAPAYLPARPGENE
jgi:hypothetical protein